MPTHFGMPTLVEYPGLNKNITLCSELGLDFVELNMNLPEYQIENINITVLNNTLANTGKYLTIRLDDNLNICSFNSTIANACLNSVIQTIEFAKYIKAPIINMHMIDGLYFAQYQEKYLDKLRIFRDACNNAIDESNIIICIEKCSILHEFQQRGIDLLLESRRFALTYDDQFNYQEAIKKELCYV